MALLDTTLIKVKEDVLSRILDGEAVLLDLGSGTYYGLNDVGSEMWRLISKGATVAQIHTRILDRFEVDEQTVRSDVEMLVAELERRGLIDVGQ